jgi:tight adherence protein C
LRLRALAEERWLTVSHEFPVVIDLTALAMNAGADLPSALAKVAQRKSGPAGDEIRQFLTALDMGVTRRSALLALEERCPINEVRDVVRAISMADQKGASVTEALVQQAQTSRLRRSVKAEESAARAGVLLMLPMMLLVACVVILLVGPLLCEANVL